jgi:hypothetical protein
VAQLTKSLWRAFRGDGGHGALRLWAEMWLTKMNTEADAAVVDEQRKEDGFHVGWMTFSTLRLGHSAMRLGRVTPQDSSLADLCRRQEKRAAPSRLIMMNPLWNSPA